MNAVAETGMERQLRPICIHLQRSPLVPTRYDWHDDGEAVDDAWAAELHEAWGRPDMFRSTARGASLALPAARMLSSTCSPSSAGTVPQEPLSYLWAASRPAANEGASVSAARAASPSPARRLFTPVFPTVGGCSETKPDVEPLSGSVTFLHLTCLPHCLGWRLPLQPRRSGCRHGSRRRRATFWPCAPV